MEAHIVCEVFFNLMVWASYPRSLVQQLDKMCNYVYYTTTDACKLIHTLTYVHQSFGKHIFFTSFI